MNKTSKGKRPKKEGVSKKTKKEGKKVVVEENEESDHASWMYKDLEGAGDGNIFSEVLKKKVDEKIKDVLVEDWWSDDEGDEKDALRSKFVLSDDEDHLDGDGCTEFNEETVMKNIHFEIEMKLLIMLFLGEH